MKFKGAWKRISIFDPETGDVAQVNKVATEFTEMTKETIKNETSTGLIFGGYICDLTAGLLESGGVDQIEQWMNGHVEVHAVVEGGRNVLWLDKSESNFQRAVQVDARNGVQTHQISLQSVGGAPMIHEVANLAKPYGADGSSDVEIPFPVVGATITASTGTGSFDLEIMDFSGTVIGSASSSAEGGRQVAEIQVPAGGYKININPDSAFTELSVRTDGVKEYVDG
jgi:hypothetical protein